MMIHQVNQLLLTTLTLMAEKVKKNVCNINIKTQKFLIPTLSTSTTHLKKKNFTKKMLRKIIEKVMFFIILSPLFLLFFGYPPSHQTTFQN